MSDYWSALERVREHQSFVEKIERDLISSPEDRSLRIGLGSARRRAAESEVALRAMARHEHVDLLNYRISNPSERYTVSNVTESVLQFQRSITALVDWAFNGPKDKAKYGSQTKELSELGFGYTFPGSLGAVLYIKNERDIVEGKIDNVFAAISDFLKINDQYEALDASRELGLAAISILSGWVDVNSNYKNDVDFIWKRSDGRDYGEKISFDRFSRLHEIFDAAEDVESIDQTVDCQLVGLDVEDKLFHLQVQGLADLEGKFGADFPVAIYEVPARYTATVSIVKRRKLSTGKETRQYILRSLKPFSA
jgi:hypothetical protein